MASNCASKFVQRSTSSAKTFLNRIRSSPSVATGPLKLSGLAPATPSPASRVSPRHRSLFSSRLPVELSSGESLMPLHSATASVLLKSMLSSKVGQWGCLSEEASPGNFVVRSILAKVLLYRYNIPFKPLGISDDEKTTLDKSHSCFFFDENNL